MKTIKNLSRYFLLSPLLFASLLFAVLIFSSCSSSSQTSGPPFENTRWVLISVSGTGTNTSTFNLTFANGQINGVGPCNEFSGVYKLNGNVLSVSKLMSTDKACDYLKIEQQYFRFLEAAQSYDVQNGYLKINTSSDYKVMTFAPAN